MQNKDTEPIIVSSLTTPRASGELNKSPFIVDPPHSRRRLTIILGSILGVLLFMVASFGVYYFFIRIPDSEYQKAISHIDIMSSNAVNIQNFGKQISADQLEGANLKKLESSKKEVAQYQENLKQLQQLSVLKNDSAVKDAYNSHRKRIEEYGPSSANLITAMTVLAEITDRCNKMTQKFESIRTSAEFDVIARDCQTYTQNHPSVPIKDFNDSFYVVYRAQTLEFLSALHDLLVLVDKNEQDPTVGNKAVTRVQAAIAALKDKDAQRQRFNIKNTLNPQDQLKSVRTSLVERSAVLLR